MKKLLFFTLIVSAVTLGGFWGGRAFCMRFMWPGSLHPTQQWYFNLGLSPEQAAELAQLESSFRRETDALCMRICKERLDLLALIRDEKADPALIYRKIEEIGTMQVALEKEIATHILRVKQDLNPAQSQAYLDRIHAELQKSIRQSGYAGIA